MPWLPPRTSPYSIAGYIVLPEESQISCWLSAWFSHVSQSHSPRSHILQSWQPPGPLADLWLKLCLTVLDFTVSQMLWFDREKMQILCITGGCCFCRGIYLWVAAVSSRTDTGPAVCWLEALSSLRCPFRAAVLAGWQGRAIVILRTSGKVSVLLQWQWIEMHFAKRFHLPCILALTLSAELLRFLALRETDAKNPRNCSGNRMATHLGWGWRSSKFVSVFLGGSLAGRV